MLSNGPSTSLQKPANQRTSIDRHFYTLLVASCTFTATGCLYPTLGNTKNTTAGYDDNKLLIDLVHTAPSQIMPVHGPYHIRRPNASGMELIESGGITPTSVTTAVILDGGVRSYNGSRISRLG